MSDPGRRPDRHRSGGPPGWRPGFRPAWWPENEPFPPERSPAEWQGRRRWFLRRVGLVFLLFFGLMFAANALAVALISRGSGHRGALPIAWVIGILLVVGFVVVGRAVRRMAMPVGDVMEAADRVAGGDYEARVAERGPRETRRLARSFNAMTQRLKANEAQRRNLLADVAHELRTPLSVIQGNAEGMLDGLYPIDRSHLEPLLEETRVMSRLLDDLQTLSTAEAGALRLHREPVDPSELVEDAVAAFEPAASAAGIRLRGRIAPGVAALEVDPVRIGQVLTNLLSNAVRLTPAGGSVTVSAEPAQGAGAVAFAVADTGPGVAPEVLPHIFDRFVRAADSGGAGLGLAIARSLVEAHGGAISAQSKLGRGTTIRFEVPT
jgi:two-component system sensor histidine kinase BaeS